MAVLLGDDVQCLLLGVSTTQVLLKRLETSLKHHSFCQILFMELSYAGDSNNIVSISG